jgi:LacI family transcriptional regulator
MPSTIYDVARLAGVSSSMASRIVRGSRKRQDEATIKVQEAARMLGYHPNRAAASLRTTHSGLIGLVVPELRNPFFSAYAESLSKRALEQGYVVMSLVADESNLNPVIKRLAEYRVHAIVTAVPAVIEEMHRVTWDGLIIAVSRQPSNSGVPYVGMDDYRAGELIGHHLSQCGHRTVLVVTESLNIPSTQPRLSGIANAAPNADIKIQVVCNTDEITVKTVQKMYNDCRPTAIVGGSDAIALRLYSAIGQLDLKIPDQISLISFDGTFAISDFVPIPLTSVVQPIDRCTQEVMHWIINDITYSEINSPVLIPPELKLGRTTQLHSAM